MPRVRRDLLRWSAASILGFGALTLTSCTLIRFTGEVLSFTGKVATTAVKATTTVVGSTVKLGGGAVGYFSGRKKVRLERDGDAYFVSVRVNGRHRGRLVLDTGATNVQISGTLARQAGIDVSRGEVVQCTLADGSTVPARAVTLDKIQVGSVTVKGIRALVFDNDRSADRDGLLGMSFLNHFVFEIDPNRNLLWLRRKDE